MISFGMMAALAILGICLLGSVVALVCWVLFLPFKLLGLAFKGLAFLLFLPVLAAVGIAAMLVFGVGLVAALAPALPFVLIALGVMWWMRRSPAGARR